MRHLETERLTSFQKNGPQFMEISSINCATIYKSVMEVIILEVLSWTDKQKQSIVQQLLRESWR